MDAIGSLWDIASLLLYPLARYRLTLVAGRKCQKASQDTTAGVFRTHGIWKDSHLPHMCDVSHERILILIKNHNSTAGDHWTPQTHITHTSPMPLVFGSSSLTHFTSAASSAARTTTIHHRASRATAPAACCDRGIPSVRHRVSSRSLGTNRLWLVPPLDRL